MSFLSGTPGKFQQQSLLGKEQQPLYRQLLAATQGQGSGGAFGNAADYYRSLLSNDNETFNQFAAPELRRFREDIVPSLSEQFAGMGSGALSSSGFRNAALQAGTDLSERLGAIRAQLRQQGAEGLMGLGQQGLGRFNENIYMRPSPGLLETAAPVIGTAIGAFAGPAGAAAGNAFGSWIGKRLSPSGNSPYPT